jgi:hypothetical protein
MNISGIRKSPLRIRLGQGEVLVRGGHGLAAAPHVASPRITVSALVLFAASRD